MPDNWVLGILVRVVQVLGRYLDPSGELLELLVNRFEGMSLP